MGISGTSGNQSYDAGVTLDGDTIPWRQLAVTEWGEWCGKDLVIAFNATTAIDSNWTNISGFLAQTSVSLTGKFCDNTAVV